LKTLKEGILLLMLLTSVGAIAACSSVSQIQVTEFGGEGFIKGTYGNGQPFEARIANETINDADGITPCFTLLVKSGIAQTKGTFGSAPQKCIVRFGVFGDLEMVLPAKDKGEVLDPNS